MRPGNSRSQAGQHLLDRHALHVVLRAAQLAGDERKAAPARVAGDVTLGHVGERPDDDVAAIVGAQLRRHGLQAPAEEQIEEQRLDDVVAVVAERDLGDAVLAREAVQGAAAQPRAQAAHRAAFRDHALHDAVGVLLDDVERHAEGCEVVRQHVRREIRLLLVEVDGEQLEAHRRAALQRQQQVEQRVGVLAARQAHHDAVAGADHADSRRCTCRPSRAAAPAGGCRVREGFAAADVTAAEGPSKAVRPQAAALLAALSRYFAST